MDRREFLYRGAILGAAGVQAPALRLSRLGAADTVLRGATVFDGLGAPGRVLDVAITGDRITQVGANLPAGSEEIDLRGLALAPGFVDLHSHADLNLLIEPRAESRIRQGVTTEVTGQDGSSILYTDVAEARQNAIWQERYGIPFDFRDIGGFLDRVSRTRPAVNVASMVGHGTVRGAVIGGADRPATPAEINLMRSIVRDALSQGAVGLSSGLEYTPGAFADREELIALAEVLQGTGLPYASHMRNEDDSLLGSVEEAIDVGRRAQVPVQISHLKAQGRRNYWKAEIALEMIEAAASDGVDVHFDRYPYIAYATGLTNLFPAWSREGGSTALFRRLGDPTEGARIREAAIDKVALLGDWNSVQITSAGAETAWARGRRMGELAEERGVDPLALAIDLLRANDGSVGMVGFGMSEENTARFLAHPRSMIASDGGAFAPYGPLSSGSPHPRGYGTFPRVLGLYVRNRGDLGLAEAIRKMTSAPARKVRLTDRGVIRAGAYADLVAFDPGAVMDAATFADPHQYPVGIPHVIVNGVVTLRDGEHTGDRAGRGVRPE